MKISTLALLLVAFIGCLFATVCFSLPQRSFGSAARFNTAQTYQKGEPQCCLPPVHTVSYLIYGYNTTQYSTRYFDASRRKSREDITSILINGQKNSYTTITIQEGVLLISYAFNSNSSSPQCTCSSTFVHGNAFAPFCFTYSSYTSMNKIRIGNYQGMQLTHSQDPFYTFTDVVFKDERQENTNECWLLSNSAYGITTFKTYTDVWETTNYYDMIPKIVENPNVLFAIPKTCPSDCT
ncbi:hypothetical protein C9374_013394 [Naegleria lovaniensis]|uniref:Uncharacterized protein n=1 Tax=Naegleria lovaniensis TaxID=51637 RepID=A0AA88H195_NAELO|nr:uncharacterized protein C9374_013394 [Naegleria lovaniensis]KAG2391909.1 hypothetical protein C9374_013394 [Naegleria lovaniensis]